MGGRIGQRLGGAAAIVTAGAVSVSDATKLESTSGIGDYTKRFAKEYGVSGDISVRVSKVRSGTEGGGVNFGAVDANGNATLKSVVFIRASSDLTKEQVQEIIKHELTHLKQSQSGRFYFNANRGTDGYYFDGKFVISAAGYRKIMRGMDSRSYSVRQKSYQLYRNLPWEVEAHAAGDAFKISTP